MRNSGFDALKGLLILFVILGHTLLGSIDQNVVREVIYFFHMPLFLALTGYFIKYELLLKGSVEIFNKYYRRLIIPYLITFSVYTPMSWYGAFRVGDLSVKRILVTFLSPPYHLWYVPAVILYIFYTKMIVTNERKSVLIAAIVIAFTLAVNSSVHSDSISKIAWPKLLGDSRYYYLYYYFILGYLYSTIRINRKIIIAASIALPMIFIAYCMSEKPYIKAFCMVAANSIIILSVLQLGERFNSFGDSCLSKVGRVTLPIYLWHVFPIVLSQKAFPKGGVAYYLCSGTLCLMLILLLVALKDKSGQINRYLYGVQSLSTIADRPAGRIFFREYTR